MFSFSFDEWQLAMTLLKWVKYTADGMQKRVHFLKKLTIFIFHSMVWFGLQKNGTAFLGH